MQRNECRWGTFKGRQEGVVDVDGAHGITRAEVLAEDLHVSGQHYQIYAQLLQQRLYLCLLPPISPNILPNLAIALILKQATDFTPLAHSSLFGTS